MSAEAGPPGTETGAPLGLSPRQRRGLIVWTGAIAILAVFYALQDAYGCVLFQRGGAVVVVYGVLLSAASLRARAVYGEELNAIQLEQCEIAQMMYGVEHEARQETQLRLARQLEPKLKALDSRLTRLAIAAQRFQDLRVVEGPILILGTVIWGFGDLLTAQTGCALTA